MNQAAQAQSSYGTRSSANRPLRIGFLLILVAILSNGLFFFRLPGDKAFPWLGLLLTMAGLIYVILGIRQTLVQPHARAGRWILTVVSLLLFAFSSLAFFHSRALPASAKAPHVGDKVPDFTLPDINGQEVSLAKILASYEDGSSATGRPKAAFLIFYRGYW
ncbi:MAG TPA: hypothetical protein VKZ53_07495 [Candidatus Angelobacter sp.]|nr:hypothetical protein [Candidatus Angelobacter sp.]